MHDGHYREVANRLRGITEQLTQQLLDVASELEKGPAITVAEMATYVTNRLGLKETHRRLGVDPSTVCGWRRGEGISEANLRKLHTLYEELRRSEHGG